jgi:hypothetical protein
MYRPSSACGYTVSQLDDINGINNRY